MPHLFTLRKQKNATCTRHSSLYLSAAHVLIIILSLSLPLIHCKTTQNLSTNYDHCLKLQLHYAIYRLRFYSNSLIHILSLSNSHSNVASIQMNRGDKSHRVIVALSYDYTVRFIAPILLY